MLVLPPATPGLFSDVLNVEADLSSAIAELGQWSKIPSTYAGGARSTSIPSYLLGRLRLLSLLTSWPSVRVQVSRTSSSSTVCQEDE